MEDEKRGRCKCGQIPKLEHIMVFNVGSLKLIREEYRVCCGCGFGDRLPVQ